LRPEQALLLAIARDSRAFCRHVPDGADILLSHPEFSLSSDGRLMVKLEGMRYFVADDSVARWVRRQDGRAEFVIFRDGAAVDAAVVDDAPDLPPDPSAN